MTDDTPKNKLEKLYSERDAKFNEIALCLSHELYSRESHLSEEDRAQLIDEAEELTDNWANAECDKRPLQLSTALQSLLSEHQEICKQIIEILDGGNSDQWSKPDWLA